MYLADFEALLRTGDGGVVHVQRVLALPAHEAPDGVGRLDRVGRAGRAAWRPRQRYWLNLNRRWIDKETILREGKVGEHLDEDEKYHGLTNGKRSFLWSKL